MSLADVTAFEKIEARRKLSPGKSIREILQVSGVNPASYYRGKRTKEGGGKVKRALKAASTKKITGIIIPPAQPKPRSNTMTLLIGSPEQIRQVLAGQI